MATPLLQRKGISELRRDRPQSQSKRSLPGLRADNKSEVVIPCSESCYNKGYTS